MVTRGARGRHYVVHDADDAAVAADVPEPRVGNPGGQARLVAMTPSAAALSCVAHDASPYRCGSTAAALLVGVATTLLLASLALNEVFEIRPSAIDVQIRVTYFYAEVEASGDSFKISLREATCGAHSILRFAAVAHFVAFFLLLAALALLLCEVIRRKGLAHWALISLCTAAAMLVVVNVACGMAVMKIDDAPECAAMYGRRRAVHVGNTVMCAGYSSIFLVAALLCYVCSRYCKCCCHRSVRASGSDDPRMGGGGGRRRSGHGPSAQHTHMVLMNPQQVAIIMSAHQQSHHGHGHGAPYSYMYAQHGGLASPLPPPPQSVSHEIQQGFVIGTPMAPLGGPPPSAPSFATAAAHGYPASMASPTRGESRNASAAATGGEEGGNDVFTVSNESFPSGLQSAPPGSPTTPAAHSGRPAVL